MKRARGYEIQDTRPYKRQSGYYMQPQRVFVPRTQGALAVTERKYFDSEVEAVVVAQVTASWGTTTRQDPATLNTLFCPVRGNAINEREGNSVWVKKISLRGWIFCGNQTDATATDNPALIRLILVLDKQTNATQLTASDVISSGGANTMLAGFQNTAAFGRFQVMKDKFITLKDPNFAYDGTNFEQNGLITPWKITHKFRGKGLQIRFNNTNAGTVADIVDNSFHVLAGATDINLAPKISYKSRVVYCE